MYNITYTTYIQVLFVFMFTFLHYRYLAESPALGRPALTLISAPTALTKWSELPYKGFQAERKARPHPLISVSKRDFRRGLLFGRVVRCQATSAWRKAAGARLAQRPRQGLGLVPAALRQASCAGSEQADRKSLKIRRTRVTRQGS